MTDVKTQEAKAPDTKPSVSVIIPNYNGEGLLRECLDSVEAQGYPDLEIIVVDDASQDQGADIAAKDPNVRLIQNTKNSGFAYSVNRGIEAATKDYLLLLNNDVVLQDGFIEAMAQAISQSERIFSVSSKMLRYKEPELIDDTGDFINVLGWGWKRGDGMPARFFETADRVFSACAGAGIYRASSFDEIGLFDENHFAYLEDIDIGWRAMIYGYENRYEPSAKCLHIGSATMAEGARHSSFKVSISARNTVYLLYKNLPYPYLILNSPFLAAGVMIKYLYFRNKGFEKDYVAGLKEGFRGLKKLKKIPITKKNRRAFFLIELHLLYNVLRYISEKLEKAQNRLR